MRYLVLMIVMIAPAALADDERHVRLIPSGVPGYQATATTPNDAPISDHGKTFRESCRIEFAHESAPNDKTYVAYSVSYGQTQEWLRRLGDGWHISDYWCDGKIKY